MTEAVLHRLDEAEQKIEEKSYREARVLLTRLRSEHDKRPLSTLEQSRLAYLFGRYYYNTGDYPNAYVETEAALTLSRIVGTDEGDALHYSQRMLWGLILQAQSRLENAIEVFNEVYVWRMRRPGEDMSGPLINLALAHFQKGDLPRALDAIGDAEQAASSEEDRKLCRRNRARFLPFAGEFLECEDILNEYERSETDENETAMNRLTFGILRTFQGRHQEAITHLRESMDLHRRLGKRREVVICCEYIALHYLHTRRYRQGVSLCKRILRDKGITVSARAQTLRILIDTYVARREYAKALWLSLKATEAIEQSTEIIEECALNRALGIVHSVLGNYQQARERFEKSIAGLERISAYYELAVTVSACANSPAFTVEEQSQHERAASDLCSRMRITRTALYPATASTAPLAANNAFVRRIEKIAGPLLGLPTLLICTLLCTLSITTLDKTWFGLGVFVCSATLAVQTAIMMLSEKRRNGRIKRR